MHIATHLNFYSFMFQYMSNKIFYSVGLGDSIDSIHNRDSALQSSNAIVGKFGIRIAHVIYAHA